MSIIQISTSNTFGQWLTATQELIVKYNTFEDTTNLIFVTANNTVNVYSNTVNVYNSAISDTGNIYSNTVNIYSNTVNVYSNTVNVYSNTVNVYNSIQSYVNIAFNTANAAFNTANAAFNTANASSNTANAAFNAANAANSLANTANVTANAAYYYAINATGQVIPPQTANTGKYLSTDGTYLIWNTVDALPSQTGNGGKYLTTDGSTASWANIAGGNTASVANTLALRDSNADLYANNFISTSDVRLKEDVRPIENALSIVRSMQGVRFRWKETSAEQIGLIAQEVEKVLPYVVFGNDLKSVNYGVIVSVLIEAIKELAERLDRLEE